MIRRLAVVASGAAIVVVVLLVALHTASSGHHKPAASAPRRRGGGHAVTPRHTTTAARRARIARDLGEMIVSRMSGTNPGSRLLARIRAGQVGGVILFSENFALGAAQAARMIAQLQRAARSGGTWPLLIMTDQEGGPIRRLDGAPPLRAPREMESADAAYLEGLAAGRALARVGVNVDLAPVADVESSESFLGTRSFGASAELVARRACSFATGLRDAGVGYTLKHFPGLGTATASTDYGPVTVTTPARELRANYAAYRRCGRGRTTLVMVSNASYPTLTGNGVPAVMSPPIFHREAARAGIEAVTISDDLQAGALREQNHPALHAIRAGLDLLLYAQTEAASEEAYVKLAADIRAGALSVTRIENAGAAIRRLKTAL